MPRGDKRKRSAPLVCDEKLTARVCAELSANPSIEAMCANTWAPGLVTHYRWMAGNEAYRNAVDSAKADGMERLADESLTIADEVGETSEAVAKARLRIDTRKWLLAKLKPKKYGDKVEHEHSGGVTVEIVKFGEGKATG